MSEQLAMNGKAKKDRPKMLTAESVISALRLRYPKDQYALITEVGNSTGFKCQRHADVVVMGLWPSRGMEIIGIEVKVRRSDFLKELEQPEKADAIAQYCDRWFVAVGDAEIVKEGELPPMWGLLVPSDGKKMRCAKEATQMADVKPLDRGFIASMLRNAQCQLTGEAELMREFQRGRTEGIEVGEKTGHWKEERELDRLRELEKLTKEFEETSGVNINNSWQIGKIGETVRMIVNGTYMSERASLEGLRSNLVRIMERVDSTLEKTKSEVVLP